MAVDPRLLDQMRTTSLDQITSTQVAKILQELKRKAGKAPVEVARFGSAI